MPKVLFAGSVKLDLWFIFSKVKSLNESKGPFDLLFCVGSFADDEEGGHSLRASMVCSMQAACPAPQPV